MIKIIFSMFSIIVLGILALQSFQEEHNITEISRLSPNHQDITNFEQWLNEKSRESTLIILENGCLSFEDPPPPCACPTPTGGCIYVQPNAICYNGTQPFCP